MSKKIKGPEFLRYAAPVLETLKALGGTGTANEVTEATIRRLKISAIERDATTSNGQPRVRNQIGWARFYLDKAGLLASPRRGVWSLTPSGHRASLDEAAVLNLYQHVHARFTRVTDEAAEESAVPEDDADDANRAEVPSAQGVGVEEEAPDPNGQEIHSPYDASKTHISTKPMSVEQFAKRLRHDEIDLRPDFQRKADLWTTEKKSQLIESMLIRIPLPVFYFDATDDARWLVVDGLQRLSTIRHFMIDEPARRLRLKGLEYLHQHEGKTFEELPRDLQRRIEETQVFAHLIQPGTPVEVKYNIFKRINTGGLVLTAQEIRHALFQKPGGAVTLLRELAGHPDFLAATDRAISDERMLDCEFVLRFVSFSLTPYLTYTQPDMDGFLNRHMHRLNDDGDGHARDDLRHRFVQAMRGAVRIFDRDAFRKRYSAEAARMPINKALFEVWSVALGRLDAGAVERLVGVREKVRAATAEVLVGDRDFEASISQGTGDPRRVHKRFATVEEIIRHCLQESP